MAWINRSFSCSLKNSVNFVRSSAFSLLLALFLSAKDLSSKTVLLFNAARVAESIGLSESVVGPAAAATTLAVSGAGFKGVDEEPGGAWLGPMVVLSARCLRLRAGRWVSAVAPSWNAVSIGVGAIVVSVGAVLVGVRVDDTVEVAVGLSGALGAW